MYVDEEGSMRCDKQLGINIYFMKLKVCLKSNNDKVIKIRIIR